MAMLLRSYPVAAQNTAASAVFGDAMRWLRSTSFAAIAQNKPSMSRPLQYVNSLEHERRNPDRIRDAHVWNFSPFAEQIHRCGADGEGLRSLTDAEKPRRDARFPPLFG